MMIYKSTCDLHEVKAAKELDYSFTEPTCYNSFTFNGLRYEGSDILNYFTPVDLKNT